MWSEKNAQTRVRYLRQPDLEDREEISYRHPPASADHCIDRSIAQPELEFLEDANAAHDHHEHEERLDEHHDETENASRCAQPRNRATARRT